MADTRAVEFIQEEKFDRFNALVESQQGIVDLSGAHLRSYDLRKCHLNKADLSNAYLRAADLRGLDLSNANLAGASIKDAKISGTLFPVDIPAIEILLGVQYGTRLRVAM